MAGQAEREDERAIECPEAVGGIGDVDAQRGTDGAAVHGLVPPEAPGKVRRRHVAALIARAEHEMGAGTQLGEHLRDQLERVARVGHDHDAVAPLGIGHAESQQVAEAGAPLTVANEHAHVQQRVAVGQLARQRQRPVGRAGVDDQDLRSGRGRRELAVEALDRRHQRGRVVEGRDDDRCLDDHRSATRHGSQCRAGNR